MIRDWIIAHFPPHVTYVEPYGGAASVLLGKSRASVEVYNDRDDAIVNVFRVLRDPMLADRLARAIYLTPWARREFEAAYEPVPDPADVVERARRTLVKSFMGFGSSAVVRSRTGFRATSARNKVRDYADDWANYPDALRLFVDRLRGVTIEHRPALELFPVYDRATTLWYLDPPYPHSTRGRLDHNSDHNGYRHEMSDNDHRALGAAARAAQGMVVVSGYPCALYDEELFPDWERVTKAHYANGHGMSVKRTEVLWLSPAASCNLQPSLFT